MRVSVWYNNSDIRIEEVAIPTPGSREMLVKVMACGICGSDIVEWYRLPRAPLVQGHELGGEVVQVGEEVDGFAPGDRVFIPPKVPCMTCDYCRRGHHPQCAEVAERLPGAFAQYILVPAALVRNGALRLPDHLTFEQSTFIEPLGCVVRAQRLGGVAEGLTVLVLGCGMSGLLHVKLASFMNARVIATDVSANRRKMAQTMGADMTIDAREDVAARLVEATGKLADTVILSTAAVPAVAQAWQTVDKGGTVVLFTVPGPDTTVDVPVNDFWTREITIRTVYYCGPEDWRESLGLIADGDIVVDDMVTHRLPLEEIGRGFELVMRGDESLKVIINPNG